MKSKGGRSHEDKILSDPVSYNCTLKQFREVLDTNYLTSILTESFLKNYIKIT